MFSITIILSVTMDEIQVIAHPSGNEINGVSYAWLDEIAGNGNNIAEAIDDLLSQINGTFVEDDVCFNLSPCDVSAWNIEVQKHLD